MGEAAHLPAVVVNDDRTAVERLVDEPRNHHPVMPDLPRPDDVEESPHHDRQLDTCGDRPAPETRRWPSSSRRPSAAATSARETGRPPRSSVLGILAVDFAGRRQKDPLPSLPGQAQQNLGRIDVGFDRPHRIVGHQLHADRGRQVIDDVDSADDFGQHDRIGDRADVQLAPRMRRRPVEIVANAGRQDRRGSSPRAPAPAAARRDGSR